MKPGSPPVSIVLRSNALFRSKQRRVVRREERHTDLVRAGRDRQLHVDRLEIAAEAEAAVDTEFLVPVELRHGRVVDKHLQLLAAHLAERAEVAHVAQVHGEDFEGVLGVDREVVTCSQAAARAERQALDVVVLRRVCRHAIRSLHRTIDVAERHAADLAGGRQIRLEQRGRKRQGARLVVEAAARVVGRQELRCVDLDAGQIANGVRVLGAIHTMRARRREVRLVALIELRRKPMNDVSVRRGIGALAAVARRHHAGAELAQHLLPHGRVGTHVGETALLEREPARSCRCRCGNRGRTCRSSPCASRPAARATARSLRAALRCREI